MANFCPRGEHILKYRLVLSVLLEENNIKVPVILGDFVLCVFLHLGFGIVPVSYKFLQNVM